MLELPVGYHSFHKSQFLNYQLNRWYSLGYSRKEDLLEIGQSIRSFEDYISAFLQAAEEAKADARLKNAASYTRAAEFLIEPDDHRKIPVYQDYIHLFDEGFKDEPFVRHQIPYQGSYLSAIHIPSKSGESKGTVIGIPGFDAFIEEFFCIWDYFAENGYDCIAFEGPGQGGSRRIHQQYFDHDYEKPVKAVLDHFDLEDVAAVGVSMGGYWMARAAAFEPRISQLILWPPLYDWLEMTNSFNAGLAKWFLTKPRLTNFFVKMKMSVGTLRHTVNNALYIQNKTEPFEAVQWMMGMNKEHLHSHQITQDVLLLAGENDAFQPLILHEKQKAALVNAKTITERIFLKSESADQHCQMGNLGLALQTMVDWLDKSLSK